MTEATVRGVCVAALTPIDGAGNPDGPAAAAYCNGLLAAGCDAINLLGTTGEAMSFSVAQRSAVMESVAARVPLASCMVGTGASALADAVELTRRAIELGYAGALVMPPFYFKNNSDDGIVRFFDRLIAGTGRTDLAVYLYHFPQLSGISFAPALVARLVAEFPGVIVGIKDSSGVAGYAESIVAAAPIAVYPSSEATLERARESGFAGCISATLNVTARIAAEVWRDVGLQTPEALRARERLAAARALLTAYPLVPALRALVARSARDDGWRRMLPPLFPLPADDEAALYARFDAIVPALAPHGGVS